MELNSNNSYKRPVGTRGAQVNLSRFRVSQLDKAGHQYELTRDLNEFRNNSIKMIVDTAHMGVGGDVSWLPSVHDAFKIKFQPGSTWEYQINLNLIKKSTSTSLQEEEEEEVAVVVQS